MPNVINATSTGNGGLITQGDDSGILNIQTNETTAITVDASQRVGIGTASPNDVLEVAGNDAYIRVNRTGNEPGILLTYSNSGTNRGNIAVTSGGAMYFTSGGNTERMRINSNGALLINKTSQAQDERLGITGNSGQQCAVLVSPISGDYDMINFRNTNGQVGRIGCNGTATSYITSSDYRLKENIAPMTGALAKVAQLKPVIYKWKVNGSDGQGFIAHELAEVVPDCVSGEKDAIDANGDIQPQGIDTSFLVATLTAALQETKALIDTQAETINALTARIVALESKGTV
jgi:hypothetical protein